MSGSVPDTGRRFEPFGARHQRSDLVSEQAWRVVQEAKDRRNGRAALSWAGVPLLKDRGTSPCTRC